MATSIGDKEIERIVRRGHIPTAEQENRKGRRMSKAGEGEKETRRKGRPTLSKLLGRQRASSTSSIFDTPKRKREEIKEQEEEKRERIKAEEELTEQFQKTRKVGRSPPAEKTEERETEESKKEEKNEDLDMDKIDKLTEIILTIKKDTEDIRKVQEATNREIIDLKEEWKKNRKHGKRRRKKLSRE